MTIKTQLNEQGVHTIKKPNIVGDIIGAGLMLSFGLLLISTWLFPVPPNHEGLASGVSEDSISATAERAEMLEMEAKIQSRQSLLVKKINIQTAEITNTDTELEAVKISLELQKNKLEVKLLDRCKDVNLSNDCLEESNYKARNLK